MTSPGATDDWHETGPADKALGLIADARRRGADAASRLADQLIDPARVIGRSNGAGNWRTARRDAELALDSVVDLFRDAMARAEGFVEQARGVGEGIETITVDVWPGVAAESSIWIHNVSDTPRSPLRIRLGELIDVDGNPFAGRVGFDPELLPPVDAHESVACELNVSVLLDTAPGEFHGLVMVLGAGEVQPLHLVVRVQPS